MIPQEEISKANTGSDDSDHHLESHHWSSEVESIRPSQFAYGSQFDAKISG